MANNALIQGAARTGKKFLDVGGAVAAGMAATPDYKPENRVAENKAIQNRVNSYMGKMKTDMDFTSFSPSETKTMRNFLLSQRTKYTDAAKKAAEFDDTTDPNYMMYVDEMQSVNNTFTNLASQLGSYKKGKLGYAQAMQEGLYSNGNPGSQSKEAAIIYGFYDSDGDGRSEDRYDAPFQIQDGGNIAFNVGGKEITYNGMEEPFLKDTKFLNGLNKTVETAYASGASGRNNNTYAQETYKQQLNDSLQNEDTLRSIIFDFEAEADLKSVGKDLDSGAIDIQAAREKVTAALTQARDEAFANGAKEYEAKQNKAKQNKATQATLTLAQQFQAKDMKKKLEMLEGGLVITGRTGGVNALRAQVVKLDGEDPYYEIKDAAGDSLYETINGEYVNLKFTLDEVKDRLGLNVIGL